MSKKVRCKDCLHFERIVIDGEPRWWGKCWGRDKKSPEYPWERSGESLHGCRTFEPRGQVQTTLFPIGERVRP